MVLGTVIARDSDSEMRESAARLLREKQWTGAEEQLARAALRDGAVRVRRECRRALALVGGEESRPVLHRVLLAEPNKKYRLEVAELLEGAPIPMDRGPLLGALDDPYTKIAMAAARGLARLGDKSVAAILRKKALESKSRAVAEEFNQAAATLGG
jgi:HEAT repeat protein